MKPSQWFKVFKGAAVAWSDDYAPSMGAAISYYTLFSLAPLLVLVIALAGMVFGAEAVRGQISTQLSALMGPDTAVTIEAMVQSASISDKGIWATLISIAVLLVGATSVFSELQSALDRIWHVPESRKPSGIWGLLRARLFSLGLILVLAFLLMVSLAVSALIAALGTYLGTLLPGQEVVLQILNAVVAIAVTTALFAMIFKWLPTAKVAWPDVWVGAVVTALLFEIGKTLIGLYLGKSAMSSSFAGAGALVILIAWVNYAAQIFLLGAEFTKVYAHEHGSAKGKAMDTPTQLNRADAEQPPPTPVAAATAARPAPALSRRVGPVPAPVAAPPAADEAFRVLSLAAIAVLREFVNARIERDATPNAPRRR